MANLKGSSFEKQIKDALIRLDARGTKRTGEARFDGMAHSHAILEKRRQMLQDFSKHLDAVNHPGKLNEAMTRKSFPDF